MIQCKEKDTSDGIEAEANVGKDEDDSDARKSFVMIAEGS